MLWSTLSLMASDLDNRYMLIAEAMDHSVFC